MTTANLESIQFLLLGMRKRFLDELPERCDGFDNLILALEATPDDGEAFNELFRRVHSLKGSGGTYGLPILTTVCHHLENLLSETAAHERKAGAFATRALAYVDLLRRVEEPGRSENPDYAAIEADLEALRQSALQSRRAGLIAESSAVMAQIYRQALAGLPVQLSVVGNGLTALERLLREPFDFAVVGRELKELDGIALVAALRASQAANRNIPVILVTSNRTDIPAHARFTAILSRDQDLAANLAAALRPVLRA